MRNVAIDCTVDDCRFQRVVQRHGSHVLRQDVLNLRVGVKPLLLIE